MSTFRIDSPFSPQGDQPEAIRQLVEGVNEGTELTKCSSGVTGSGKTFTMANVIAETQRPTLVLSHNKTLAAQLYSEFKAFFPDNLVEYFVSYYDYYQPEAFIPSSNTYIEKDLQINDEIEKLGCLPLLPCSVADETSLWWRASCIYGIGNPVEFHKNVVSLEGGATLDAQRFTSPFGDKPVQPSTDFKRGNFRVKGDTVDVHLAYADHAVRIEFWDDEIERLSSIDPESGQLLHNFDQFTIYPANLFVSSKETTNTAVWEIQQDLEKQKGILQRAIALSRVQALRRAHAVRPRDDQRVGLCSGIENYSRYFDRRQPGERPVLPVGLLRQGLPGGHRRESRDGAADWGHVRRRPPAK